MLVSLCYSFRSLDVIGPSTDVIVPISGTDVIVPKHVLMQNYFFFNSGMEYRILCQMCGRLYFPIFLFRIGLFTLMYMDSLMVLARLFPSLPIILKLFSVI